MINRDFYKRFIHGAQLDTVKAASTIEAGEDLKRLLEHPGWKRVQAFMDTQRKGSIQYVEHETDAIGTFSLVWLFNTFIKWVAVSLEIRAYNRIQTYIKVTIDRADKYRQQQAKEEARKEKPNG